MTHDADTGRAFIAGMSDGAAEQAAISDNRRHADLFARDADHAGTLRAIAATVRSGIGELAAIDDGNAATLAADLVAALRRYESALESNRDNYRREADRLELARDQARAARIREHLRPSS